MKTFRVVPIVLIFVVALCAFSSCRQEDPIVGSWKNEKNGVILTFKSDGTGTVTGADTDEVLRLTYTADGQELTMTYFLFEETVERSFYNIEGNTLRLYQDDPESGSIWIKQ